MVYGRLSHPRKESDLVEKRVFVQYIRIRKLLARVSSVFFTRLMLCPSAFAASQPF